MLQLLLAALLVPFAPTSRIWLEGDSTLHRYHADATRWTIQADAALSSLVVELPVQGLKSGDAALDANMYKALKADRFPTIRFAAAGGKAEGGRYEAPGKLSIAGAVRPVVVHASGDEHHVKGAVELKMTSFGIQPPALFAGTVKCSDAIVVRFDLVK
jgi:polyisoprenoid-binding protein YceI